MSDLRTALREYLVVADAVFRQEMRDGVLTMEDAKKETAEIEKWRQMLAVLEAGDTLYGGVA